MAVIGLFHCCEGGAVAYLQREDDPDIRYELKPPSATIGRADSSHVALREDMRVSRHHARIDFEDDQWVITDAGSTNGTLVNGRRISTHSLRHGDRILIGGARLVFVPVADPLATITEVNAEPPPQAKGPVLSDREREVLALVGVGRTDRQIADELYLSVATVRSHLDRIRDKTGCRRRPDLTRLAMEIETR
jgi:DNA-binding CsgD family transcriptional regulator